MSTGKYSMGKALRRVEGRDRRRRAARAPTVRNVNRKVNRIQRRQELGWKDVAATVVGITVPVDANITPLNGLSQGNTSITRVGDHVRFTSLQYRCLVSAPATAIVNDILWRFVIFRDAQSNGTDQTLSTLLFDTTATTNIMIAPYNLKYAKRFKVYVDRVGKLSPNQPKTYTATDLVTNVIPVSYIRGKIKLGVDTNYSLGNAGTPADIEKNAFYCMCISTETGASGLGASFNFNTRMIFKDI